MLQSAESEGSNTDRFNHFVPWQVDVTQVILAIPPEYLHSLPLGLEELSSTVAEAQNTHSFGQNPAAFLINKLLNMSFTKEEFARSRGIGKYLQVTHQQRLDPVKVQAVKGRSGDTSFFGRGL